jgi:hypothetical protein
MITYNANMTTCDAFALPGWVDAKAEHQLNYACESLKQNQQRNDKWYLHVYAALSLNSVCEFIRVSTHGLPSAHVYDVGARCANQSRAHGGSAPDGRHRLMG